MKKVHEALRSMDFFGIILVPEEATLFNFYKRLGYTNCAYVEEKECTASKQEEKIKKVTATEYFKERRKYLHENGITHSSDTFKFLDSLVYFYIGEDFISAIQNDTDNLFCVEFLGNDDKIGGFIKSMGYDEGCFRLKGKERPFAMFISLKENVSEPQYLGFAFD